MQQCANRSFATLALLAGAAAMPFVLSGCSHFQAAHGADHADHASHASSAALVLNNGKKWETDAPLRAGMLRIRALVAPLQGATAAQSLDPTQAKAVADGVQAQVAYLVSNCKLAPQADAVLHVLIAQMLDGAQQLAQDAPTGQGIVVIGQALRHYPQYFDHPAWPAL